MFVMGTLDSVTLPRLFDLQLQNLRNLSLVILVRKHLIISYVFQCRNVVWLPGSILEATVTTNICSFCTPGSLLLSDSFTISVHAE